MNLFFLYKRRMYIGLLLLSLLMSACASVQAAEPEDLAQRSIRAVATTGMVADLVSNIGGTRVQVTGLMGPGIDPHVFKPSERDVVTLAAADVIFYNGLHLEAQMAEVFEKMQGRARTVAVAGGIDPSRLAPSTDYEGYADPHVWFDVSLWMEAAYVVRDALSELDPQHAAVYQANAAAYLEELQTLHEYVLQQAQRVPPEKRVLITAHDAFSYFGRAYGFEVRGLQGISTAAEAGTADVQALAAFIAEHQIPAIFVESSVPARTIEAVQAAVRSRGYEVVIGGELFSDALGTTGTPEGEYIGMVQHNINTIVESLLRESE
jgi:manganese/zinc/iron transport system substrate-binding protein